MIPEHPAHDSPDFLEWVNTVIEHRHGNLLPLKDYIVFEQEWPSEKFDRVKMMNRNTGPRKQEPVIILRGLKRDYLLDGNRRINSWDRKGTMPVWLVCPVYKE